MEVFLSIVVPALNEGKNIVATYEELLQAVQNSPVKRFEILLIDDCSQDNTFKLMQELSVRDSRVRAIHNEKNLGLGGSYKRGIELARGTHYMLAPGDNAWPAAGLSEVIRLIGRADIVIPYIIEAGDKGPIRKFLSRGFTNLMNMLFGLKLHYYNGVVVHKIENLRKIKIEANCFAYQAEALVKLIKGGCSYVEIGLNTSPRPDGKSKAFRISNLVRVLKTVLRLRFTKFELQTEIPKSRSA